MLLAFICALFISSCLVAAQSSDQDSGGYIDSMFNSDSHTSKGDVSDYGYYLDTRDGYVTYPDQQKFQGSSDQTGDKDQEQILDSDNKLGGTRQFNTARNNVTVGNAEQTNKALLRAGNLNNTNNVKFDFGHNIQKVKQTDSKKENRIANTQSDEKRSTVRRYEEAFDPYGKKPNSLEGRSSGMSQGVVGMLPLSYTDCAELLAAYDQPIGAYHQPTHNYGSYGHSGADTSAYDHAGYALYDPADLYRYHTVEQASGEQDEKEGGEDDDMVNYITHDGDFQEGFRPSRRRLQQAPNGLSADEAEARRKAMIQQKRKTQQEAHNKKIKAMEQMELLTARQRKIDMMKHQLVAAGIRPPAVTMNHVYSQLSPPQMVYIQKMDPDEAQMILLQKKQELEAHLYQQAFAAAQTTTTTTTTRPPTTTTTPTPRPSVRRSEPSLFELQELLKMIESRSKPTTTTTTPPPLPSNAALQQLLVALASSNQNSGSSDLLLQHLVSMMAGGNHQQAAPPTTTTTTTTTTTRTQAPAAIMGMSMDDIAALLQGLNGGVSPVPPSPIQTFGHSFETQESYEDNQPDVQQDVSGAVMENWFPSEAEFPVEFPAANVTAASS